MGGGWGPWGHTQLGSQGPSPSGFVLTGREIPASVAAPALGNYCPQCSQLQLHSLPFLSSEVPSPSRGWSNHPHAALALGPGTLGGGSQALTAIKELEEGRAAYIPMWLWRVRVRAHVSGCLVPVGLCFVHLNVLVSVCPRVCFSVCLYIHVSL